MTRNKYDDGFDDGLEEGHEQGVQDALNAVEDEARRRYEGMNAHDLRLVLSILEAVRA